MEFHFLVVLCGSFLFRLMNRMSFRSLFTFNSNLLQIHDLYNIN
jgi:hypothetical protein